MTHDCTVSAQDAATMDAEALAEIAPDFTPGPWHITRRSTMGMVFVHAPRDSARLAPVASCPTEPGDGRTTDANATLIAAAPTMFAALLMAHDALNILTDEEFARGKDQPVREAIAAALKAAGVQIES